MWEQLDQQLAPFADELQRAMGLTAAESRNVATLVAADVRALSVDVKRQMVADDVVPLSDRLDELAAFQSFMEIAGAASRNPVVVRAQTIVQNYVCFVYLKEPCFSALASAAPAGSVAYRCASFLSNGKIRAFRNAFSHGNWRYKADFSGLEGWTMDGGADSPVNQFVVTGEQLGFWQALARAAAYVTYSELSR